MNNNLFHVLLTSIKTKVTPLYTKLRRWMSWSYIRTQVFNRLRAFFTALLDVRPKHKKDYYEVFGWLVSKRLAFAIVVAVGVLSLYYLTGVKNSYFSGKEGDGVKTYAYNSVMLRFAEDKVRIKGRSGYLAYEGDVKKGSVTGTGTLYNPAGTVVYQGSFVKNKYDGSGTSYYDDGTMRYKGEFKENLYDGTGRLYRENGSLYYEGDFSRGMREGKGTLYNTANNEVYQGSFSQDELVYSELLGKTTSEVQEMYSGSRTAYEGSQTFAVVLEDIGAMYMGQGDSEALDDSVKVESIYVLKPSFRSGGRNYTTIDDLKSIFGDPVFEGNSEVTMAEAVAINRMCQQKNVLFGPVEMEKEQLYTDYTVIDSFDQSYTVYLYAFEKDGLLYTFLCSDKNDTFAFYYIMKEEGGAEE